MTTVDLPIESLWEAASEIPAWPAWDREVRAVRPQAPVCIGTGFLVIDASGRHTRSEVEECSSPSRFAYVTPLFLGLLRTRFEFVRSGFGTRVRLSVGVSGLLGPVWRCLLRQTKAGSLSGRLAMLVRRARDLSRNASVSATSAWASEGIVDTARKGETALAGDSLSTQPKRATVLEVETAPR